MTEYEFTMPDGSNTRDVLDLFSAAAGGWSLGMHRAGFQTMAACENVDWRRALYQENNPDVLIYDDVCTLTADRILRDCGRLPSVVVGSPPCQDISSANTKGKGVEGARSGLYFEAVRIIGECRPRWFALENSANLRTRGADAVLAALEAIGYACWSFVVRAGDIGANHERPRCWIIGCDVEQVANTSKIGRHARPGNDQSRDARNDRRFAGHVFDNGDAFDAESIGHEGGRTRGYGQDGHSASPVTEGDAAHSYHDGQLRGSEHAEMGELQGMGGNCGRDTGDTADANQARQANGRMVPGLRSAEITDDGRGAGRSNDGQGAGQMAVRQTNRVDAARWKSDWSLDDFANHLRLDHGLSSWLAGTRIAVGGSRGTSAASLVVEAFGDAVVPQIPEAIGKAILRTEAALAAIYGRAA